MPINLGSSSLGDVYLGSTQVQKMYLGSNLVYNNAAQTTQFATRDLTNSDFAGLFDPAHSQYNSSTTANLIDSNFYRAYNRNNTIGFGFLSGSNTEKPGFIPKPGGGVHGVAVSRLEIINGNGNYRDEARPQIPPSGTDFPDYDDWASIATGREVTYSFCWAKHPSHNYMSIGVGGVGSQDNKYGQIINQKHPGTDGDENSGQTPTFDLFLGNRGDDGVNDSEDGIKLYLIDKLLDKYLAGDSMRLLCDDVRTPFQAGKWMQIIFKSKWVIDKVNPDGYVSVGYRFVTPGTPSNDPFIFPSSCTITGITTFAVDENRADRQITYDSFGNYNQWGTFAGADVFATNFGATINGTRQDATYFHGYEILDHSNSAKSVTVGGQTVAVSAMTDTQKNEYMRLQTVSS